MKKHKYILKLIVMLALVGCFFVAGKKTVWAEISVSNISVSTNVDDQTNFNRIKFSVSGNDEHTGTVGYDFGIPGTRPHVHFYLYTYDDNTASTPVEVYDIELDNGRGVYYSEPDFLEKAAGRASPIVGENIKISYQIDKVEISLDVDDNIIATTSSTSILDSYPGSLDRISGPKIHRAALIDAEFGHILPTIMKPVDGRNDSIKPDPQPEADKVIMYAYHDADVYFELDPDTGHGYTMRGWKANKKIYANKSFTGITQFRYVNGQIDFTPLFYQKVTDVKFRDTEAPYRDYSDGATIELENGKTYTFEIVLGADSDKLYEDAYQSHNQDGEEFFTRLTLLNNFMTSDPFGDISDGKTYSVNGVTFEFMDDVANFNDRKLLKVTVAEDAASGTQVPVKLNIDNEHPEFTFRVNHSYHRVLGVSIGGEVKQYPKLASGISYTAEAILDPVTASVEDGDYDWDVISGGRIIGRNDLKQVRIKPDAGATELKVRVSATDKHGESADPVEDSFPVGTYSPLAYVAINQPAVGTTLSQGAEYEAVAFVSPGRDYIRYNGYMWDIIGGRITSASNTRTIKFVPNANVNEVTLTVTAKDVNNLESTDTVTYAVKANNGADSTQSSSSSTSSSSSSSSKSSANSNTSTGGTGSAGGLGGADGSGGLGSAGSPGGAGGAAGAYDAVPKTGESKAWFIFIFISVFALIGTGYGLYLLLKSADDSE